MVIAWFEISGGVEIGRFALVDPNASNRQQKKRCKGALIGIVATVLKNVPESAVVVGSPAKQISRTAE